MIYIHKGPEPEALKEWKKENPSATYKCLSGEPLLALRNALLQEQGFVCCFCGKAIGVINLVLRKVIQKHIHKGEIHNISNAHITPQSVDKEKTLDYNNICASCNTRVYNNKEYHCDYRQGDKCIPISPLQTDCLSFFSFNADGTIVPNTQKSSDDQQKALETIEIFGLNDNWLKLEREKRLQMFLSLPENMFEIALNNISKRGVNGEFEAFYFVPLSYYNKI